MALGYSELVTIDVRMLALIGVGLGTNMRCDDSESTALQDDALHGRRGGTAAPRAVARVHHPR